MYLMHDTDRMVTAGVAVLFLLFLIGSCSGSGQKDQVSFTGQVTWVDLEGGFYGIMSADGRPYAPLNLPEDFQVDGVTVAVLGDPVPDTVTIQMWGEPIEITSITPVKNDNPFAQSWYEPGTNRTAYTTPDMAEYLLQGASGLQYGLDSIDSEISTLAENISKQGLESESLPALLLRGMDIPGVLQVAFMDETGVLRTIVPENRRRFEGADVSDQEFSSRMISYPAPGMSEYFRVIEGSDAVVLTYPVFSDRKKVTGYISALIDPRALVQTYSLPCLNGTPYEIMVTEPDGTYLYDDNPDIIGQKTWGNPIFYELPDLLNFTAHYQNAKAGVDQYSYYRTESEEIAQTNVIWTTVGLHGTEWRIFLLSR